MDDATACAYLRSAPSLPRLMAVAMPMRTKRLKMYNDTQNATVSRVSSAIENHHREGKESHAACPHVAREVEKPQVRGVMPAWPEGGMVSGGAGAQAVVVFVPAEPLRRRRAAELRRRAPAAAAVQRQRRRRGETPPLLPRGRTSSAPPGLLWPPHLLTACPRGSSQDMPGNGVCDAKLVALRAGCCVLMLPQGMLPQ